MSINLIEHSVYNNVNNVVNDIKERINQTEFKLNNGEDLVKEYCKDLKNRVHEAKEKKLKELEETKLEMIAYINQYEQESLESFSKVDKQTYETEIFDIKTKIETLKKDISSTDNTEFINRLIDEMKSIQEKLKLKQDELKQIMLATSQEILFKTNTKTADKHLGSLDFASLDTIDYNGLQRVCFGTNQLRTIMNGVVNKYDSLLTTNDIYEGFRNISEVKMLPNNTLHVLFELTSQIKFKIVLLSIIVSREFYPSLSMSKVYDLNNDLKLKPKVYYSNRKTYVITRHREFDSVLIYDENYTPLDEIKLINKCVIDVNDDKIYVISNRESDLVDSQIDLEHYEIINFKIQNVDPSKPFYVWPKVKDLLRFESNGKFYWIIQDPNEIRILDEANGLIVKIIKDGNVNKIEIDSRNNIVLFKDDQLMYYNVKGYFLKEVKLVNFFSDIKCGVFFVDNKIACFDPFTFELSFQKEFCSFDTFQNQLQTE